MLGSYRVMMRTLHVILAPAMWEDLPEKYFPRRPRPATFSDSGDMAAYTSGWLIEGRVEPHILGPGLQDGRSADERGNRASRRGTSSFTLRTIPTARREKMPRRIYWSERTSPKRRSKRFSITIPCDSSASRNRAEFV